MNNLLAVNCLHLIFLDASKSGPVPPLLTWQIVQKKMAWNVILLLGGGFAMAHGSQVKQCNWMDL